MAWKIYKKTCKVEPRKTANMIESALCGEDGTEGFHYERTVKFENGIEIEIACYGKNVVNDKEVEPWVDVTMYKHGIEVQQIITKNFFDAYMMQDNNEKCYGVCIARDYSKFRHAIFYDENGNTYFAVSKEIYPRYKGAKNFTAFELYKNKNSLVYNDEYKFTHWRAGHDNNGKSCVGWFLESEDSPTSCPVWVFTVK